MKRAVGDVVNKRGDAGGVGDDDALCVVEIPEAQRRALFRRHVGDVLAQRPDRLAHYAAGVGPGDACAERGRAVDVSRDNCTEIDVVAAYGEAPAQAGQFAALHNLYVVAPRVFRSEGGGGACGEGA